MSPPSALIADDEPLLRDALTTLLRAAWPALSIVAQARNGREAIELFDLHEPAICFLDVQMPGLTGIDAARHIAGRAELVFVTAYDQYAVQAFEQGAIDYLVKPVEPARLSATVRRLQGRLETPRLADDGRLSGLLRQLTRYASTLRYVRAQVGRTLRMIPVDTIDFFRADAKYTIVGWRDDQVPAEAILRTSIKELAAQLDPSQFAQVHRAAIVNLRSISHVLREDNDTASVHLRGRKEVMPVSRSYLHLFKQM